MAANPEDDEMMRQAMLQIAEMERADADAKKRTEKEERQRREKEDERMQQEEEEQMQRAIRLSEESAKSEAAAAARQARRDARPAAPAAASLNATAAASAQPPAAPRRSTLPPSGVPRPAAAAGAAATAAAVPPPRKSLPSSLELLGSGRGSPVSPAASMPTAPPARKRKNSERAASPTAATAASPSPRHSPAAAAAAQFPAFADSTAVDASPLHALRLLFPGPSPFVESFLTDFFRTHSRAEAPMPATTGVAAASAAASAAVASSSSAAAVPVAFPHSGFDGVGFNGVPYRNLEVRSDRDLIDFVHALRILLRQSPQTVLPPEVVRALWAALQSEEVSIGCVESLAADLTGLLVLSPHNFLPSLRAWEAWCHQALEFNTWLQAKDKAQKEGELERIKDEVLSSAAEASASPSSGIPALFRLDSELTRQRKIAATLAYQEQQEIHYQKWCHVMRIWTDAFILDILARQRGTAHVATEIMDPLEPYSPDLLAKLPPSQLHPHWPPPLLYSLVTHGAHILTYTVSEADAAALAAQPGPKLQTEEDQLAAVQSVLAAPMKKGAAGRGRGRGRGRSSRGGRVGSRGGRGGKAEAAASPSSEVSHPPSVKRARTSSSSCHASDRDSADSADDGDAGNDDNDAAGEDDADGAEDDDDSADVASPMASFLLWWLEIPRWIGLDPASSAASRADHAAQRTIAATFRSRQALQTFQDSVTRFLDVVKYVNGAQDQRLENIRLREEAHKRGKKHIDTEQGLVAF